MKDLKVGDWVSVHIQSVTFGYYKLTTAQVSGRTERTVKVFGIEDTFKFRKNKWVSSTKILTEATEKDIHDILEFKAKVIELKEREKAKADKLRELIRGYDWDSVSDLKIIDIWNKLNEN